MMIISYDIKNDKLRNHFYKFIKKYGYRLQYSVYRIDNSNRYINLIKQKIEIEFEKEFSEDDSIVIFDIKEEKKIIKYGNAIHEDQDLIIVE